MDDSQLVYVSFSNQALAHLPYMVALDETSRYMHGATQKMSHTSNRLELCPTDMLAPRSMALAACSSCSPWKHQQGHTCQTPNGAWRRHACMTVPSKHVVGKHACHHVSVNPACHYQTCMSLTSMQVRMRTPGLYVTYKQSRHRHDQSTTCSQRLSAVHACPTGYSCSACMQQLTRYSQDFAILGKCNVGALSFSKVFGCCQHGLAGVDMACRSVVVAVRGTATMEDVITDSVAAPDLLDRSEWLPESFKQQQAQTGPSPAHCS